jgi:hypothetical protein
MRIELMTSFLPRTLCQLSYSSVLGSHVLPIHLDADKYRIAIPGCRGGTGTRTPFGTGF